MSNFLLAVDFIVLQIKFQRVHKHLLMAMENRVLEACEPLQSELLTTLGSVISLFVLDF